MPKLRDPSRAAGIAAGVLVAAAVVLLDVPSAFADPLTPESESGSPNAVDIDSLYKITLYVSIVIFLLVEGTLVYALVRFRRRRGGPEPAQIRGNTPLELAWTVGAALILVVLATVTFVYLDDIRNPEPSDPGGYRAAGAQLASVDQPNPPGRWLKIGVNPQQYLFRYDYLDEERLPGGQPVSSYYELVVPVKTTVVLEVTSSDVIHAWWVPKLGGKVDGVPGKINKTWFKVPRPGVFRGQCAELCGANHADMRTRVRVVPVAAYERWLERQRRGIVESRKELARARARAEQQ